MLRKRTVGMFAVLLLAPIIASGCGEDSETEESGAEETGVFGAKDSLTRGYGKADGTTTLEGGLIVSASTVEALGGDLSSVQPKVVTPAGVEAYLAPTSALGYFGPIGPYGPLGMLGPVGDNSWNASYWISGAGDWSDWSKDMTDLGGPLSQNGPLGPAGPLSKEAYEQALPAINDFCKQLQAGGVWGVLGPVGPLGALGPLGPLGPIGAHGLPQDEDGNYVKEGDVQRAINVPYDGTERTYELFETYDEKHATTMADNDTSFMVEGRLDYEGWYKYETDRFEFASSQEQFVTILLLPEYQLDDFDLDVLDAGGQLLAASQSYGLIDWVQLRVPAGTKLEVEVKLYSTQHVLGKRYRLIVTGSTPHFSTTDILGDHQLGAP